MSKRAIPKNLCGRGPVSEMTIVDMFTQLIFDAETALDESGLLLLELLSKMEPSLLDASRRDFSEYLRAMNVSEMIVIVADIKEQLDQRQMLSSVAYYVNQPQAQH